MLLGMSHWYPCLRIAETPGSDPTGRSPNNPLVQSVAETQKQS
jgi:hypothetical protein